MKYNHQKAQDFWHRVDPKESFLEIIKKPMQQTYSFPSFISELADEIRHKVVDKESLKSYIIIAAEAIYKGLADPEVQSNLVVRNKILAETSKEELFGVILNNLFSGLSEDDSNSTTIGEIQRYYECD